MTYTREFVCKHCGKGYIREKAYLEHMCKQMKRQEEIQTPAGQAAWTYYQCWFRTMKKMPPQIASFMESKYYRTFINFSQFVNKVQLPMPEKFIWLMVTKEYPPSMWMLDDVYVLYLEFLDYKTTPMEQVNTSINTLFKLADSSNIDVADVFSNMHPSDLIQMLRTRQLSPWLLLMSRKFKEYYVNKTNTEQQQILETLIPPEAWATRFEKHAATLPQIKRCVSELGI